MKSIDFNCDLGEGAAHDAELMPLVSSANIACGGHAGDATTMRVTVELAQHYGVAVGAHPSYEDRESFGRRKLQITATALHASLIRQIEALCSLGPVRHVKPHGALYNVAASNREVAEVVVQAVSAVDDRLILYGLAGSELVRAARASGLSVVEEVFGDRTYRSNGSLTPREDPRALIRDPHGVVAQVLRMVHEGSVETIEGRQAKVSAETVCLHGDGANVVELARSLRRALEDAGIRVQAPVASARQRF
jgi:UPF0271 protein